jgi:SAM-dependent methyltransferase
MSTAKSKRSALLGAIGDWFVGTASSLGKRFYPEHCGNPQQNSWRKPSASVEWFAMPGTVDLYNNAYAHYDADVYCQVRRETYGEDLGQTGWTTIEESTQIPRTLRLTPDSNVLVIGCGSGRYALQVAATIGCRVIGLDLNAPGIHNANRLAVAQNLSALTQFHIADASQPLPFPNATFDAAFCNDVLATFPTASACCASCFECRSRVRLLAVKKVLGWVPHSLVCKGAGLGFPNKSRMPD